MVTWRLCLGGMGREGTGSLAGTVEKPHRDLTHVMGVLFPGRNFTALDSCVALLLEILTISFTSNS